MWYIVGNDLKTKYSLIKVVKYACARHQMWHLLRIQLNLTELSTRHIIYYLSTFLCISTKKCVRPNALLRDPDKDLRTQNLIDWLIDWHLHQVEVQGTCMKHHRELLERDCMLHWSIFWRCDHSLTEGVKDTLMLSHHSDWQRAVTLRRLTNKVKVIDARQVRK